MQVQRQTEEAGEDASPSRKLRLFKRGENQAIKRKEELKRD